MDKNYEIRLKNVKLMHNTMIDMNNENAYMAWIWEMPDCPYEDRYMELYTYFTKLLKRYAKDGLFRPSESVQKFVSDLGIEIEILN